MSVGSFGISEGNITGEEKENPQNMCLTANTCGEAAHVMVSASSKWGLGSEAWAVSLFFRVRIGLQCPEDNLRELM